MEYLKRLEAELMREWRSIQIEKFPRIKEAALKAYYKKLRIYHGHRAHCLRMNPDLPSLQTMKPLFKERTGK